MNIFAKDQKVIISFVQDEHLVEMTCNIESVYSDRMVLELPQYFMRYIKSFQVGKSILVKVFIKMGTVDFKSVIISSPLEDCFAIELDYNAIHLQNIEDISAVKDILPLELVINGQKVLAKTLEVSTMYIKFQLNQTLDLNTVCDAVLQLPNDYDKISFKAIISEVDLEYSNEYTLRYSVLTDTDRRTILYYMYDYVNQEDQELI